MAKRTNKFEWEVNIGNLDSLHRLHLILAYHLMGRADSLKNINIKVTLDEESAGHIHAEIQDFVEDRHITAKLTMITDGEEPLTLNYPIDGMHDLD